MQRLRFYDVRLSRLPGVVGLSTGQVQAVANVVNTVQRRLVYAREAGDEGWWGSFAEIGFNVSRSEPYITLPREIARLQSVNVCRKPFTPRNQFHEYLDFGTGRMPKSKGCSSILDGFMRNNAVTFKDLGKDKPRKLAVYIANPEDAGKRIFISGKDQNGAIVVSQELFANSQGVFLTFEDPSAETDTIFSVLTGIQKDVTAGQVHIFQVDPDTGEEVLLHTMEPGEQTAWYRRYYFNNLPAGCCAAPDSNDDTTVQVTAIAKLELLPVVVDTDYLLIQNIEALIEEAQSMRLSEVDGVSAKQQAAERHTAAIRLLQGELAHYMGKNDVSVNVNPFGSARLERRKIGTMI